MRFGICGFGRMGTALALLGREHGEHPLGGRAGTTS